MPGNFSDRLEMKHKFIKYLKENCGLDLDEHYSNKQFTNSITTVLQTLILLILSCLDISLVVWTFGTYEYNFEINHGLTKYLKENCGLD